MSVEPSFQTIGSPPGVIALHRTVASYECELRERRVTETQLRNALARDEALLVEKDELIQRQELLGRESDHRLLNDLQLVVSLLSLQGRGSTNAETARQLGVAANRVATILRIHRRLHSIDGAQTVAFNHFLEDLCGDFSIILSSDDGRGRAIAVEGTELSLPSITGISLALIVNELITNAIKHGDGSILVRLEPNPGKGYALSVSNDGPALPEGFNPAASKGLGMRIVRSLVSKIDGELQTGRGNEEQETRFTVLFA